jgi:hypothetical protein
LKDLGTSGTWNSAICPVLLVVDGFLAMAHSTVENFADFST